MVGHYKTYITNNIGHSKSDSVGLLVLWTVAYNIQGIKIVLQVPQDSANLIKNG